MGIIRHMEMTGTDVPRALSTLCPTPNVSVEREKQFNKVNLKTSPHRNNPLEMINSDGPKILKM